MKKIILLYFVVLFSTSILAQKSNSYYRWPIDGEVSLSANYGELRTNHFHGGLDFRVGGVPGKPIYAAADGYVARIVVRPDGYGKAVYINHPNGTTSVYGHLHNFAPAIQAYVENIQYSRQRFRVDNTLDTATIPIKKGELIGNAGNTGTSFGAHLHFEIRDTKTDVPVNVFSHGYYKVPADTQLPVIRSVAFFAFREPDSLPCITKFNEQELPGKQTKQPVNVPDTFFVAIDAIDKQNGTAAKLAFNRLTVALDNDTIFACHIEAVPFDLSRYINSTLAYEELQRNKKTYLKTYIEPGNQLDIYDTVKNNGLIVLPDTLPHKLSIHVTDDAGNTAFSSFTVRKRTAANKKIIQNSCDSIPWLPAYWDTETVVNRPGLNVVIPKGALYRNIRLALDTLPERYKNAYSPTWRIHSVETPLHYAIRLSIAAEIPDSLKAKALIAGLTAKGVYSADGKWYNGTVETNIRSFGDFFVTVDTVPPSIKPLFNKGANVSKQSQLKIRITDNLSGIAGYNAYIDGTWALFEYDAKNNMLICNPDPKRIKRNKKHELLLVISDNKQNTATLQTTFVW